MEMEIAISIFVAVHAKDFYMPSQSHIMCNTATLLDAAITGVHTGVVVHRFFIHRHKACKI